MLTAVVASLERKINEISVAEIIQETQEEPKIFYEEESSFPFNEKTIYTFTQSGFALTCTSSQKLYKAIFYLQAENNFNKYVDKDNFFAPFIKLNDALDYFGKPHHDCRVDEVHFYYFQKLNYWIILKFGINDNLITCNFVASSALSSQFNNLGLKIRTCKV